MPGHCHYDHELGLRLAEPHKAHDYGKRALFLLRGRDRSGRNDFSVGHKKSIQRYAIFFFADHNSHRKRGETDRPRLRSTAPALDPTEVVEVMS